MTCPDRTSARWLRRSAVAMLAGLALSAVAAAQTTTFYTLDLISGESLNGVTIVEQDDDTITLLHPLLGVMKVQRSSVISMTAATTGPEPEALVEAKAAAAEPPPEAKTEAEAAAEAEKSPWSGHIDLGLSGSEGNTETMVLRAAAGVRRETEETIFQINARYRLETSNGDRDSNSFNGNIRHDWLLPGSPWGIFAEGLFEYDEFKDYDFRIDLLGGFTYDFIRNDTTLFQGRAGAGAFREFGGNDDSWEPVAVFGLRLEHAFNDDVRFVAFGDYYPQITDWGKFRVISGANIEVDLNESGSLVMKAGVIDIYDSDPGNAKKQDLDYYVTLGFKF